MKVEDDTLSHLPVWQRTEDAMGQLHLKDLKLGVTRLSQKEKTRPMCNRHWAVTPKVGTCGTWGWTRGWENIKGQTEEGGFPGVSDSKISPCNVGGLGSIPGLGRSPGEGKGYPPQYPGLENSMDCIQSMGLQRVGHDWVTFTFTFIATRLEWFHTQITASVRASLRKSI